jgi:hypothetical protein
MPEDSTERRLVEEPAQHGQQLVDRGDTAQKFIERRKGIDSIPGVPAAVVAQAATDAAANSAAGQSEGAEGEGAPVDYDG